MSPQHKNKENRVHPVQSGESTAGQPSSKLKDSMGQHVTPKAAQPVSPTVATITADVREPDDTVRLPDTKPPRVPSRKGKGPTPGSWKPGQSGNPKGGPRSGLALATAIRERIDPQTVLDLVVAYIADETVSTADKLDRLLPWLHAGYLKPPTATALHVTGEQSAVGSLTHLSTERLEQLLAEIRGEMPARSEQRGSSEGDEP